MRLIFNGSVFRFNCERCGWQSVSIISIILLISTAFSYSQTVNVRVDKLTPNDTVVFSPISGKYVVISGQDTLYKFGTHDVLRVMLENNRLALKGLLHGLDTVISTIQILGEGFDPQIKIKLNLGLEETYANNLTLQAQDEACNIINNVDIDNYVSRVLLEEVGYNVPEEYLKIQAIISRTYAIKNLGRHQKEGFDLCNTVHCQVYDGKREIPSVIHKATAATSKIIITDSSGAPILAAFHANCGGQTANSEDVWNSALPYLTSIKDTFCLTERSAIWQKEMPLADFKMYLRSQANISMDSVNWSDLHVFTGRNGRTTPIFGEPINLPIMRRELRLRSTLFDINVKGEKVVFSGRGFGHGVGLCQQGAIRMARLGYDYKQILGFYFKGTKLKKTAE